MQRELRAEQRAAVLVMDALLSSQTVHIEYEQRTGERDATWSDWYAEYMVREQAGTPLPT